MHMTTRLPFLAAVLLVAAPFVGAETPFTDQAPASAPRRPFFFQMKPANPAEAVRPKPAAIKPNRPRQVTVGTKAAPKPPLARAAVAPTARVAAAPAARVAAAPPALAAVAPPAVLGNSAAPRAAKQAVDDRADQREGMADDVGTGARLASKPLDEGAYIGGKHQALVRKYYEAHPASSTRTAQWKIGEPVPRKAALRGIPDDLRARLPVVPPGHQYAQLDGEVVLFAVQSRMVVDGVSRVR